MGTPDETVEAAASTRPYVVLHVAVSLDGSTSGFEPDVGRFYELAATWHEDVSLAGADTILAQEQALAAAELPGPASDGPTLAVVDGRRPWHGGAPGHTTALTLVAVATLEDGLVWMRHRTAAPAG